MNRSSDEKRESPPNTALTQEHVQESLKLEFQGSVGAYFRVWIVNVCLTLLTLGVFSAWATVRTKRYFYSHTVLDGTPFRYLASPIQVLKGRLVAVALFSTWYSLRHYMPWLFHVAALSGLLLAPWVLVRAAAFNASTSAFRNIRFEFKATYWSACKVLASALLLGVTGLGIPWAYRNVRRFLTNNVSYAGARARLRLRGARLVWPWFGAVSIVGCSVAATVIALVVVFGRQEKASELEFLAALVPAYLGYRLAAVVAGVGFRNAAWGQTRLGPFRFHCAERTSDRLLLGFTNAVGCVVSCGLLIPWARVRLLRYQLDRLRVHREGPLEQLRNQAPRPQVGAAGAETATLFEMDASI